MVEEEEVNIKIPKEGIKVEEAFSNIKLPKLFDHLNVNQEELLNSRMGNILLTSPSGFGKTSITISMILDEIMDEKKREKNNIIEDINEKHGISKANIEDILSKMYEGKSVTIKDENKRGRHAYPLTKGTNLSAEDLKNIVVYLDEMDKVKIYPRHNKKYMKLKGGLPHTIYITGSLESEEYSKMRMEEYSKETPIDFTKDISKFEGSDIALMTPKTLEVFLDNYDNIENILSNISYIVVDDIDCVPDLPLFRYLYLRLVRLVDEYSKGTSREIILSEDISNWKKLANMFFGDDDYKRIRGKGNYNVLQIKVHDADIPFESYENEVKKLLGDKNHPLFVFSYDNEINNILEQTPSSSVFEENGSKRGVTLITFNDKYKINEKAKSVIFYGAPPSFNSVHEIGNRVSKEEMSRLPITIITEDRLIDNYFLKYWDERIKKKSLRRNYVSLSYGSRNLAIKQLLSAAKDKPLSDSEAAHLHPQALTIFTDMQKKGRISHKYNNWSLTENGENFLQRFNTMRSMVIEISDSDKEVRTTREGVESVFSLFVEGSAYIHKGERFIVKDIDWDNMNVFVQPSEDKEEKPLAPIKIVKPELKEGTKIGKARNFGKIRTRCQDVQLHCKGGVKIKNYENKNGIWGYGSMHSGIEEGTSIKTRCIVAEPKKSIKKGKPNQYKDLWAKTKVNASMHYLSHILMYAISIFNGVPVDVLRECCYKDKIVIYPKSEEYYGAIENAHRNMSKVIKIAKNLIDISVNCCNSICPNCISVPTCGYAHSWIDKKNGSKLLD